MNREELQVTLNELVKAVRGNDVNAVVRLICSVHDNSREECIAICESAKLPPHLEPFEVVELLVRKMRGEG